MPLCDITFGKVSKPKPVRKRRSKDEAPSPGVKEEEPYFPMSREEIFTLLTETAPRKRLSLRSKSHVIADELYGAVGYVRTQFAAKQFVSNREWQAVRPLLEHFTDEDTSSGTLRWCVDCILYMERSGAPWPDFLLKSEVAFVQRYRDVWVGSGLWAEIRWRLAHVRTA